MIPATGERIEQLLEMDAFDSEFALKLSHSLLSRAKQIAKGVPHSKGERVFFSENALAPILFAKSFAVGCGKNRSLCQIGGECAQLMAEIWPNRFSVG